MNVDVSQDVFLLFVKMECMRLPCTNAKCKCFRMVIEAEYMLLLVGRGASEYLSGVIID